jgi:hypothetical protein
MMKTQFRPSVSGTNSDSSRATDDQRQHARAKINYFACIRSEAFGDEIVPCVDISRGGLSFRSKFAHLIGGELRIAVPFSPDAPVSTSSYPLASSTSPKFPASNAIAAA